MYQKYKNAELVKPSGLDLKDRLVGVQRVTKVTKGGRAFGFSAIVVVGDEAGVVGHGLGKSKGKTSNEFYEDVLGYSRPRAHNNMFFSSIKDAGIVKMERQGRQFVYSLGPNYQDWVEGKLLRV